MPASKPGLSADTHDVFSHATRPAPRRVRTPRLPHPLTKHERAAFDPAGIPATPQRRRADAADDDPGRAVQAGGGRWRQGGGAGAGHPWAPRRRCRDAGTCPRGVSAASRPGMRRRSLQRHLPLVQIGSFGRMLQRVHRAGCLVGTEHRTAPAARADRLNGALAQLPDRGGVMHGHRCLTGVRPGGGRRSAPWRGTPPAWPARRYLPSPPTRSHRRTRPRSPSPRRPAPPRAPRSRWQRGRLRPGSECARRTRDTTRLAVSIQPPFPSRVIPAAGPGRCGPDQVPRSPNDGPRPVIAPRQSDR